MEMSKFMRKYYPGGYPEKIASDTMRLEALRADYKTLEAERDAYLPQVPKSGTYTLAANMLDAYRLDLLECGIKIATLEADIAYDKSMAIAQTDEQAKAAYEAWIDALAKIPEDPRNLSTGRLRL